MVRVEVPAAAPGVMVTGEKAQLKPLGNPLQESVIAWLKEPDCGLAVTVKFPDFPAGIVAAGGDALKDNVDEPVAAPHAGL
jgi:hypothetical protein